MGLESSLNKKLVPDSEEYTGKQKTENKKEPVWAGEEQEKERSAAAKKLGLSGRPSWGEISEAEAAREKNK